MAKFVHDDVIDAVHWHLDQVEIQQDVTRLCAASPTPGHPARDRRASHPGRPGRVHSARAAHAAGAPKHRHGSARPSPYSSPGRHAAGPAGAVAAADLRQLGRW